MPSFTALADIINHGLLWRAGAVSRVEQPGIPTGFAQLDSQLPGGGWPVGTLTELLPEHEGIGEVRALGPALARLSSAGRWLAWISPPYLPYAPALEAAGIDLGRVMIVRVRSAQEGLWATEQALQSGACGAVLCWPGKASFAQLRRLQIAAEGSTALGFIFRTTGAAREASPAALRLHLQSIKGELAVKILKRRGGPVARPILLTPAPVVEKPAPNEPDFVHAIDSVAVGRVVSAAPATRILPSLLIHG